MNYMNDPQQVQQQQYEQLMLQQQQEQAAIAQAEAMRAQELEAQAQEQLQVQSYQPPSDVTGGGSFQQPQEQQGYGYNSYQGYDKRSDVQQPQQQPQEAPSLFGLFRGFGVGASPAYSSQALEQYRAAQQKAINDDAYRQAMMTNEQRASYMLTRGGGMLAQAIGGMLGGVDPAEQRLMELAQAQQGQDLSTSAGLRQAAQGIKDPVTRSQYLAAAQAAEDKEMTRTASRSTTAKAKALEDALLQATTVEEIDAAMLKYGDGAQRRDVLKASRTNEKEASAVKNFSTYYSKKYPNSTPEEVAAIASDPELRKAVADPTKSMFEHIKTKDGYVIYDKKTGRPVSGGSVTGGFGGGSGGSGGGAGAGGGQATGAAIGVGPAGEQVYRTKAGALVVYGSDGSTVAYQGEVLPKGSAPKVTEDQAKAAGWTAQIDNASNVIYEVIEKNPAVLNMSGTEYTLGKIPVIGEDVANSFRSPDRQRFVNAASAAAEAALRAATGAGVNNQEQRQKIAELTPQLGDSVEVIKDKLNSLKMYAEALRLRAGPAIKPKVEGEPAPKVGAIIDGHRYIGGDPASALAWKKLAAPKGGAR